MYSGNWSLVEKNVAYKYGSQTIEEVSEYTVTRIHIHVTLTVIRYQKDNTSEIQLY